MKINENYKNLEESYLFSKINEKVRAYQKENPEAKIIRLGIGDVILPLTDNVVNALVEASKKMGKKETFKGYGEEQGYLFLRKSISDYYKRKNVFLDEKEIFISDGAKSDLGNILDIFSNDNKVLIPNPVYPVYVDTNVMAGREISFLDANKENNFLPLPPKEKADIIYLCSPNNPTGACYSKEDLKKWVDYALENNAIILYDAAYEAFVTDETLPTSIYQIEGAKKCAIEFCSLSKTCGFTGVRCGYTVVPLDLVYDDVLLNKLWVRRQTTKFNGVSYIVQEGAEACFTEEGIKAFKANVNYYLDNCRIIKETLDELGIWYMKGINSPYIWLECPNHMESWDFFDFLLQEANIVGTPGLGFGENGRYFFRLTAFQDRALLEEAMRRLKNVLKK